MRNGRAAWACVAAVAVAAGTVGLAWAQGPAAKPKASAPGKGKVARKGRPGAGDPLALPGAAKDKDAKPGPAGTFHYTFKITAFDGTPLAASYYPAKGGTSAPVVLMVHEKDRSSKDFEDKISELKGQGLAEHMQANGYAVFLFDLRGHGLNPRRVPTPREWGRMIEDVQAAYVFLVDRNNRGEVNLGKLGVVGLGEGANLVAAWTEMGGGVSQEGRVSDVGALVLVSPQPTLVATGPDASGFLLREVMQKLTGRVPLLLMAGERDPVSGDPVRSVRPIVERGKGKANKVELFDSSLHGYKLLWLEPKATGVISRYLEGTIKFKAVEWEPRYNLTPVNVDNILVVRNSKTPEPAKAKDAAPAKAKAKE